MFKKGLGKKKEGGVFDGGLYPNVHYVMVTFHFLSLSSWIFFNVDIFLGVTLGQL